MSSTLREEIENLLIRYTKAHDKEAYTAGLSYDKHLKTYIPHFAALIQRKQAEARVDELECISRDDDGSILWFGRDIDLRLRELNKDLNGGEKDEGST